MEIEGKLTAEEVADNHNYYVGENNVLVHNASAGHGGETPC